MDVPAEDHAPRQHRPTTNLRLEAAMPHALYAYFHPVLK